MDLDRIKETRARLALRKYRQEESFTQLPPPPDPPRLSFIAACVDRLSETPSQLEREEAPPITEDRFQPLARTLQEETAVLRHRTIREDVVFVPIPENYDHDQVRFEPR